MTNPDQHIDESTALRTLTAAVDAELAQLAAHTTAESFAPLQSAWTALTLRMALGPEPLQRECPSCRHIGRRDAQRCGFCWTELAKPKEAQAA